ncbi:MAG TPA: PaaI family thioesterase [Candidatus Limnocylindria bacterium]|nr:PaaI family thioesterase [Candidatus Limnocylindria bacterium]
MSSAPRAATEGRGSATIVDRDGRRYAFADHNCFACGAGNPIGLHLAIQIDDGEARTTWTPGDDYVGWESKVHGGLLATLLDEVMAWAPAADDAWAVTAEMNIRYRTPANPGERLSAVGRVTSRRRRIYQVHGEVRGEDGRLVAEAEGRFLGATPSEKADLKERYAQPPARA